jgi:hypothetical protein
MEHLTVAYRKPCEGGPVSSSLRRVSTGAAAWTLGAVASVAVSMLALTVIGGVGGNVQPPAPMPPLDGGLAGAATTDLASPSAGVTATPSPSASESAPPASPTPPAPSTGPAAASPTPGPPRQFTTYAGVVTAECVGQLAYLVSWSPAPGYRVDDVWRGPAAVARVTFVMSSTRREAAVGVGCVSGVPTLVHANE